MDPKALSALELATPCAADWEKMSGDERARFCGLCSKHVYNLSALDEGELRALIIEKEGQFCGRFFLRADGTVLTRDCWVGTRRVRNRVLAAAAVTLAVIAGLLKWAGVWEAATEVGALSAQLRPPPPIRIGVPMTGVPVIPANYAETRKRNWPFVAGRRFQGRTMGTIQIIRGVEADPSLK